MFGLRRDGQFQSGTARFARAGAQRPVSYCDEKSGPWPASRLFDWRAIGMAAVVADRKRSLGLRESRERELGTDTAWHARASERHLDLCTPPATLLLFSLQPSCLAQSPAPSLFPSYFFLITASSSLSHHFRFGYANPQQTRQPGDSSLPGLFPTSIANRAPIFSLSTTMKSAIAIAAASAALANAAATPVQVAARAETSSATSSGSVPQVSVKGNGT